VHDELLEHELSLLNDTNVILVCPSFGRVSFSYTGILHVVNDHPVVFHLLSENGAVAILFTVEDVQKLEKQIPMKVIRLKGPHDYTENFEKFH